MRDLEISRLSSDRPTVVGRIDRAHGLFMYDEGYLAAANTIPLSNSLPLRPEPFNESKFRPYFEGLLAEGVSRQALMSQLQIPENDYLSLLAACGKDCIGDVVISDESIGDSIQRAPMKAGYDGVSRDDLRRMFESFPSAAKENVASRLSLAGAQNKVGLAHNPSQDMNCGWMRPKGWSGTTHILKTSHILSVPEVEYLCMNAAAACGIHAAEVALVDVGMPVVAVKRFDRRVRGSGCNISVVRLHQEDLAQAFGVNSVSKYAELPGGSVKAISTFLRAKSARPLNDIAEFAKMLLFAYAIGDCDRHLKNYSIVSRSDAESNRTTLRLAPAYDLVSTTLYPRYSRDLAMRIGGARSIDDVDVGALFCMAEDLGISSKALVGLAGPIVKRIASAVEEAAEGDAAYKSTAYVAEDLIEDMRPRLEVLEAFCHARQ